MRGMRLSAVQNKALQGLTLQQRLEKLNGWLKAGEITEAQFRYFSNRLIRKGHKRPGVSEPQRKRHYQTVFETTLQKFVDELQHKIKHYVAYRNENEVMLKDGELAKIKNMLSEYRLLTVLDDFLIIAMRYPDKRLNELAVNYVKKWRMDSLVFWAKLWADENLVPMDAVRLMMLEEGKIDRHFGKESLFYLLPLIEAQRDKEIQRLEWAQATGFLLTAERRNRRLEAFNMLLEAIKKI